MVEHQYLFLANSTSYFALLVLVFVIPAISSTVSIGGLDGKEGVRYEVGLGGHGE